MQRSQQRAETPPGHVVVIGGGIAGLAAAHHLVATGLRVTLLEATDRLGGKLMTGEVAGVQVDLGAESMLARRPEAVALAREVGLADRLQPPATATASLWTRDALRPMPKGHVMGVPGDPAVLGEVLSPEGLARIAEERDLTPTPSATTSRSARTSPTGSAARSWTGWWSPSSAGSTPVTPTGSRCAPPSPSSSRR